MTENNRIHLPRISRRRFVATSAAAASAAAVAGVLPESLARAASASPLKFDLSQVKHLVFLMQENRSFDHYFGTFPGARGFNDPTAIKLPTGHSVFQQPDPANPDGYLEPWHMSTITSGAAAVPSLSHDWRDQHAAWNGGAMDGWLTTHLASDGNTNGSFTMGHYTEEDLPFHWALARAFTLCDNYHCAVMGPTDTNRLHWEVGGIDPQGKAGGPVLETGGVHDLTYESGAETMFNAGISYKFYSYPGSYGSIQTYFKQLQTTGLVPAAVYNSVNASGTLFGDGTPGGIGNPASPTAASTPSLNFSEDCANGVLPDVSFIGTGFDEHPPDIPAGGAAFIAPILEALAANEDLWNSTVFVLNYDENDGFFDHVPPPVPDPVKYPEEYVQLASPAGTPGGGLPIGAGFRVPCILISPWTTGGRIFSGLSNHTSCLTLIEAVAAGGGLSGKGPVTFPNITPWRRAVMSDFTAALRGPARPAPTSRQFDPDTTAANLAAQQAAALLPMPARPGADQQIAFTVTATNGQASATLSNNGPGSVSKVKLTLTAPSGWKVTAAGATTAASLGNEDSLTATWKVAAPAGSSVVTATLSAKASYTQAGAAKSRTAQTQETLVPDSGPAGFTGFATSAASFGPDPSLPAGSAGAAVTFNGTGSSIVTTAPDLPAPWTVGAWVDPTAKSTSATLLTGANTSIKLQQNNNTGLVGVTQFRVKDYVSTYTVPLNTWTYLTLVDDGTSVTIYANGQQVSTIAASISLGRAIIGTRDAGDLTFAKFGEVSVFNVAFTADQVAALYAAGGQGIASGLPGLTDDWTMTSS